MSALITKMHWRKAFLYYDLKPIPGQARKSSFRLSELQDLRTTYRESIALILAPVCQVLPSEGDLEDKQGKSEPQASKYHDKLSPFPVRG